MDSPQRNGNQNYIRKNDSARLENIFAKALMAIGHELRVHHPGFSWTVASRIDPVDKTTMVRLAMEYRKKELISYLALNSAGVSQGITIGKGTLDFVHALLCIEDDAYAAAGNVQLPYAWKEPTPTLPDKNLERTRKLAGHREFPNLVQQMYLAQRQNHEYLFYLDDLEDGLETLIKLRPNSENRVENLSRRNRVLR